MSKSAHNPKAVAWKLLGLILAAAIAVGLQARENSGAGADLYGYLLTRSDQSPTCGFGYIDLADTATQVPLAPGHGKAAADDGGAVVELRAPFEFYQLPSTRLVVSGNGYLAAADSLAIDDGSDFSNDCGLPAMPDNPRASQNRIYVYHDDLRPRSGGQIRQAHFPTCPRASAAGVPEACTVVEWDGFERASPVPSTQPLQVQAVLYHRSHEIALQYASLDDSRAAQATIGLQGFDGRTARQAGCNTPRAVTARQAVCFFDPRHKPGQRLAGLHP